MHIYRTQKDGTEEFVQGSNGETDREQTYGHGERGAEGEMYGESNMETYITICKIDSQWEFSVCLRKLNRGSVSTQMGRMGREMEEKFKREGTCVYLQLIPVEV